MSSPEPEPYVVEDCRGVLQLLSDGTVRRSAAEEPAFPVHVRDGDDECGVEWKDVICDPRHGLTARLYRPAPRLAGGVGGAAAAGARLPVVAYFHGGGFCIGSCRWRVFHTWCLRIAAWLLPGGGAADDPWLAAAADLSRVFLAGDSAGGNVAHHAAIASGSGQSTVRGCVLLMPAMAGEARTPSELECPPDAFLSTELADRYLRLALPDGATRDHPAINPAGPEAPALDAAAMPPVLVVAAGRDILRDRNAQYVRRMKEWGKEVEYAEIGGEQHVLFLLDPWSESADEVVRLVRRFVVDHMD